MIESVFTTGGDYADLAPYVAAVDDDGSVAFQATRTDGRSVVVVVRGGVARELPGVDGVDSHPDLDGEAVVFYARGEVVRVAGGRREVLGTGAGPLGPTADAGRVAWRAGGRAYVDGVEVGVGCTGFEGLPVVAAGGVVYRDAGGIRFERDGARRTVAPLADYDELGRFPSADRRGTLAWVGTPRGGRPAVFVDGEPVVTGFAAVRGALAGDPIVYYAAPVGGTLGVYAGDRRIVGLGDGITEFALNPVSRADAGWIAIRVRRHDGRGEILRVRP